MIKKIDENTGREIKIYTDIPKGALLPYFRRPRMLPDGRVITLYRKDGTVPYRDTHVAVFDPESGDVELLKHRPGTLLTLTSDGRAIFCVDGKTELWSVKLPDGEPEFLCELPQPTPESNAIIVSISCDCRTIILVDGKEAEWTGPPPSTDDINNVGAFWYWLYRPRWGDLITYSLDTGAFTKCVHYDNNSFQHVEGSPTDPGLVKFTYDGLGIFEQRMWTVRTDGSELTKIKRQQKGEWVHHEFWWPGGQYIAYKYLDRRNDPTVHELPWGELAPRPTQLGIADLTGREVYLSDPLCCYQAHTYVSPKGDMISGEGTLDHSFVYAAPFSWSDYKIDLQPMATIHTPFRLGAAQGVEAGFTADSRWVLYNDMVDGEWRVCAAKV